MIAGVLTGIVLSGLSVYEAAALGASVPWLVFTGAWAIYGVYVALD